MLYSGYTVLTTEANGTVCGDRDGLYHRDTRLLCEYRLTLDGAAPELVSTAQPESDDWTAVLRLARPGGTPAGPMLPQDALEIRGRRRVGQGLLEELLLQNHSTEPYRGTLRVDVDGDFRDVAEIEAEREQDGSITRARIPDPPSLEIAYRAVRGDPESHNDRPSDRNPGSGPTGVREARRSI